MWWSPSTEIQKGFPIGQCVYVKWKNPHGGDWYEPYFVVKKTKAWIYAEEFIGKTFQLRRRSLENSGFWCHQTAKLVFRTEMPEEYRRTTIGCMMESEPRKVLGLGDKFNESDLNSAYRLAASKTHPDAGGSHEDFLKVKAAYEHLKTATTPTQRAN